MLYPMRLSRALLACLAALTLFLIAAPLGASAHEVYVLSQEAIAAGISSDSPNPFGAFATNRFQFFLWGFIAFVMVSTIFFASITHRFEIFFEPFLTRLRPWAAPVARLTLGLCLIASAYNDAIFGPELPLSDFGPYALLVRLGLFVAGALILWKATAKYGALLALALFGVATFWYGTYILTYANYLGEILLALFLVKRAWEPYAFLVLRVGFGISIAFAALYGKFIHSNLALSVVLEYDLTRYFQFEPLFIVLGACIIELLIGIFFIVGFEIRHTVLFFLFWLFLSLAYFGESVWPHLILVGVNVALFMYGYDKLTVEGKLFNRGKLQPFL